MALSPTRPAGRSSITQDGSSVSPPPPPFCPGASHISKDAPLHAPTTLPPTLFSYCSSSSREREHFLFPLPLCCLFQTLNKKTWRASRGLFAHSSFAGGDAAAVCRACPWKSASSSEPGSSVSGRTHRTGPTASCSAETRSCGCRLSAVLRSGATFWTKTAERSRRDGAAVSWGLVSG